MQVSYEWLLLVADVFSVLRLMYVKLWLTKLHKCLDRNTAASVVHSVFKCDRERYEVSFQPRMHGVCRGWWFKSCREQDFNTVSYTTVYVSCTLSAPQHTQKIAFWFLVKYTKVLHKADNYGLCL